MYMYMQPQNTGKNTGQTHQIKIHGGVPYYIYITHLHGHEFSVSLRNQKSGGCTYIPPKSCELKVPNSNSRPNTEPVQCESRAQLLVPTSLKGFHLILHTIKA